MTSLTHPGDENYNKRFYFFGTYSIDVIRKLKIDKHGVYTITKDTDALEMTKHGFEMLRHLSRNTKGTKTFTAVDMSAGVGGNTFNLPRFFNKVYSVEMSKRRIAYLKYNCKLLIPKQLYKIKFVNGDSDRVVKKLEPQIKKNEFVMYIIDPSWDSNDDPVVSGTKSMVHPNYTRNSRIDLQFCGMSAWKYAKQLLNNYSKVVVLKLPPLFERSNYVKYTKGLVLSRYTSSNKKFKYVIMMKK